LDLERSRQSIRVILKRDNPLHRAGAGIQQHDATFNQLG